MLKKAIITAFYVIFTAIGANGQDILYFKDGHKDTVVLKEITPSFVKYYKYPGGGLPLYYANRDEVVMVLKKGDSIRVLVYQTPPKIEYPFDGKRNIMCANPLPILFGVFHFNYERLTKKGNWGLRAHFFAHVLPDSNNSSTAATGVDINYYLPGQHSGERFYFGAGVRSGISEVKNFPQFTSVCINNGVVITKIKSFYFGLQWGFGINWGSRGETMGYGYFSFNIGERF